MSPSASSLVSTCGEPLTEGGASTEGNASADGERICVHSSFGQNQGPVHKAFCEIGDSLASDIEDK